MEPQGAREIGSIYQALYLLRDIAESQPIIRMVSYLSGSFEAIFVYRDSTVVHNSG